MLIYTLYPGRRATLSDLFVIPDARGSSVASVLPQACEEQASH